MKRVIRYIIRLNFKSNYNEITIAELKYWICILLISGRATKSTPAFVGSQTTALVGLSGPSTADIGLSGPPTADVDCRARRRQTSVPLTADVGLSGARLGSHWFVWPVDGRRRVVGPVNGRHLVVGSQTR